MSSMQPLCSGQNVSKIGQNVHLYTAIVGQNVLDKMSTKRHISWDKMSNFYGQNVPYHHHKVDKMSPKLDKMSTHTPLFLGQNVPKLWDKMSKKRTKCPKNLRQNVP